MQYHRQKTRSRKRNIEWQFTYDEWITWWGEDIIRRGRRSGQLVMARFNDAGPYHPDNVRKATCNENHSEKVASAESRAKMSAAARARCQKPGVDLL